MAENWSWEATPDQASTPSPMQSTSSQSIEISASSPPQLLNVDIQGRAPTRLTLEETLQTCLTQLPHSTAATASPSPTTPSGRTQSDPIRAAPAPLLRQSRSGGTTSTPAALGPSNPKPTKRRSRASQRVPATVVEVTYNDFRATVHRLTGIASTPTPTPVRPHPTRANPTGTLVRPVPQIPTHSNPISSAGLLRGPAAAAPPPPPPAFWQQTLQQLSRASEQPPQVDQTFASSSTSEPRLDGTIRPAMGSSQLGSHSSGSETTTTTTQAVTTASAWWDVDAAAARELQAQSYNFMNPDSGEQLFLVVDPDLSIDQWLQQDHPGSDFMR